MSTRKQIAPDQALETLFQIIRQEALANPAFGRRLLEAVGHVVVYRGDDALAALDPILVAHNGHEEFRRTFSSLTGANIKKAGEASGLFAKKEKLPKGQGELVDLLWSRAEQRLLDLTPVRRVAAE